MEKISIVVTTYNHEEYIKEALDSILKQKDCPEYEIIIGEDCSTDNTKKILEEYQSKFPLLIKLLSHDKNIGMLQNLKSCFEHCTGDYIAILEGDDYWIDEHKLKKQYDALKQDKDALFCFSDIYLKKNNKLKRHLKNKQKLLRNKINTHKLIEYNNPIANFSCCMYKKEALNFIPDSFYENPFNADWLFNIYLTEIAEGIFIKDLCTVYRINSKGIWSKQTLTEELFHIIELACFYNKTLKNKYAKSFSKLFFNLSVRLLNIKNIFKISIPINDTKKFSFEINRVKKEK